MKRTAKLLCPIIIITMLLSLMAGCTQGQQNNAQPSAAEVKNQASGQNVENIPSWQKDTSDFKVDWYVNLSWWKWPGEYGNDYLSALLRKKTGAVINFITPAGDGSQQLATMIASGTLPDIVTVESWLDYETKMAQGGYLWPMNDLIDQFSPDFNDIIYKDIYSWYAEPDGKTYGSQTSHIRRMP